MVKETVIALHHLVPSPLEIQQNMIAVKMSLSGATGRVKEEWRPENIAVCLVFTIEREPRTRLFPGDKGNGVEWRWEIFYPAQLNTYRAYLRQR